MPQSTTLLRHGTTERRASQLLIDGPNADYIEAGGDRYSRAEGFSTTVAGASDVGLGTVEQYASRKAFNFPDEGRPAVIEVEVPGDILDIVSDDPIGRASAESGDVRFEVGLGLDELRRAWPTLPKRVILL